MALALLRDLGRTFFMLHIMLIKALELDLNPDPVDFSVARSLSALDLAGMSPVVNFSSREIQFLSFYLFG